MKILAPGEDVSWIRKPDGLSVYVLLPKRQRVLLVPDIRVLRAWGLGMMDEAVTPPLGLEWLTTYRDGLLIAMLAARGRRLRSMAALRLGHEVLQGDDGHFRIELAPHQVKTGKRDHFPLPEELTPYLRHYLDVIRPTLLGGRLEDAFWISAQGGPLSEGGIQTRIMRLTRRRFGQPFGPHRFRHAISTTAPLLDPGNPALAAGVLNISPLVVEGHYNRVKQHQAGERYAALIEQRRQQCPAGRRTMWPDGNRC